MPINMRNEQLAAFEQDAVEKFQARVITHLRKHLERQTQQYSDDELGVRIKNCTKRAAQYDLVSEKQIVSFVDATFLLGEDFDADPQNEDIVQLMRATTLDATRRAGVMLGIAAGRQHRTNE